MKAKIGFITAVLTLFMAVNAMAITVGNYSHWGLLVPLAVNDEDSDTVIGAICDDYGEILITYFDEQSHPVTDIVIECSEQDFVPISSRSIWKGGKGYLVITGVKKGKRILADKNMIDIAANAFLVNIQKSTIAYLPVIPLEREDWAPVNNLRLLHASSLVKLTNGFGPMCDLVSNNERDYAEAQPCTSYCNGDGGGETTGDNCGKFVDFRYFINGPMNACTTVVIWSTSCLARDAHVLIYDDDEHSKSVNIPLGCELTMFNVSDIIGLPDDYTEGFIRVPRNYLGPGAVGWSFVTTSFYNGAVQTLLGLEKTK